MGLEPPNSVWMLDNPTFVVGTAIF